MASSTPLPPGQNPADDTSWLYASCATASGRLGTPPGWSGARRPENRVTARSNDPQNRWTGLTLPRNEVRNEEKTRSMRSSAW